MLDSDKPKWEEIWRKHWYADDARRRRRAARKVSFIRSQLALLRLSQDARVCDVGCGSGHFLDEVACAFPDFTEFWGCDYSTTAVDIANRRLSPTRPWRLVVCDANSLPFKHGAFDIVFAIGVLEHIQRKEIPLTELARIVRPGGLLIIFYSNSRSAFAWERKFKSIFREWPYGFQKELSPEKVKPMFLPAFKVKAQGIVQGDWDFPLLKIVDLCCSAVFSQWGRYHYTFFENTA